MDDRMQSAEQIGEAMPLELADKAGMESRAKKPMLTAEALALWDGIVTDILVKAKKLDSPGALPDPGTGRYVAYALDNQGRLSLGKGHGRRKVRVKPWQEAKRRLTGALFGNYLGSLYRSRQAAVSSPGEPIAPLTMEDFNKANAYAARKADQLFEANDKAKAKATRKRQGMSRRINRGTVPGNAFIAKIAYAAG